MVYLPTNDTIQFHRLNIGVKRTPHLRYNIQPTTPKVMGNVLSNQKSIFGTSEITHIALNKPIIESDIMRRPHNLIPIIGDFGPDISIDNKPPSPTESDFNRAFWCHVIQNGIYQTWAPKYTMFSRGNIKEKTSFGLV